MLEAHATSRSTRSSGQGQRTDLRLVSSIPVTITHANPDNRQPPRQPPQLTRQPTQGLAQKLNCKYTTMSVIKKKSFMLTARKNFFSALSRSDPPVKEERKGPQVDPGSHCFRWNVSRVFRSRVRSIQCDYGVYKIYFHRYILYSYICLFRYSAVNSDRHCMHRCTGFPPADLGWSGEEVKSSAAPRLPIGGEAVRIGLVGGACSADQPMESWYIHTWSGIRYQYSFHFILFILFISINPFNCLLPSCN